VSASVNLPLHHKVQKFSSGTGSPRWSRKKGRKTVVCVWESDWLTDQPVHLWKRCVLYLWCLFSERHLQFSGYVNWWQIRRSITRKLTNLCAALKRWVVLYANVVTFACIITMTVRQNHESWVSLSHIIFTLKRKNVWAHVHTVCRFLVNANLRSLLPICLSSLCNFRVPYSAGWNFPHCFNAICYLGHPLTILTSTENFTEIIPWEPLHRGWGLCKRVSQM